MHITLKDILQAREQVDEKLKSLTQLLRNEAGEFLAQYKRSLSAGNDSWSDGERVHPFARIMSTNGEGLSRVQPVNGLSLDARNSVSFTLETVVNTEIQNGSWVPVEIRMFKQQRNIIVQVDHNGHHEVYLGGGVDSYFDACKAVKEAVLHKINSRYSD